MKLEAMKFNTAEMRSMDVEDREYYQWESPAGLLLLEDLEGRDIASFEAPVWESLEGSIIDEKVSMRREYAKAAKRAQQDQIQEVLAGFGLDAFLPLAKQIRTLAYAKAVAGALRKHVCPELGKIDVVERKTVTRKGKTTSMARVDMRFGGTFWVADGKR